MQGSVGGLSPNSGRAACHVMPRPEGGNSRPGHWLAVVAGAERMQGKERKGRSGVCTHKTLAVKAVDRCGRGEERHWNRTSGVAVDPGIKERDRLKGLGGGCGRLQ